MNNNLNDMLEEADRRRCETFNEDIIKFRYQILAFLKDQFGEKLHPEEDKDTIYFLMLTTLSNTVADLLNKKYDKNYRELIVKHFAQSILDQIQK